LIAKVPTSDTRNRDCWHQSCARVAQKHEHDDDDQDNGDEKRALDFLQRGANGG